MKFIVPFKAHSKRAKTKAQLMLEYEHRDVIGGRDPIKPATGYDTVAFEAHTGFGQYTVATSLVAGSYEITKRAWHHARRLPP